MTSVTSTAGSVSSRGSERRMKRRPPPGTKQQPASAGPGSVLTLVTDSGVVSGSNSTVTDTERRYVVWTNHSAAAGHVTAILLADWLCRMLELGDHEDDISTPSERSKEDLAEAGTPSQLAKLPDLLDYGGNGTFSENEFEEDASFGGTAPTTEVKSKTSPKKSRLPKVKGRERKPSSQRVPQPLSPSRLPRYPSVGSKHSKHDLMSDSDNENSHSQQLSKFNSEIKKEIQKEIHKFKKPSIAETTKTSKMNGSKMKRSSRDREDVSEEEDSRTFNAKERITTKSPSKSKPKLKTSSPVKKSSLQSSQHSEGSSDEEVEKVKPKTKKPLRPDPPSKSRSVSPSKKSPVKKAKPKNLRDSDDSEDEYAGRKVKTKNKESPVKKAKNRTSKYSDDSEDEYSNRKVKTKAKESPSKARSISPIKKSTTKSPSKQSKVPGRKSRKESSEEDEDYFEEEEKPSPKKSKKFESSPTKSKKSLSQSPAKKTRESSSPVKKSKKDLSKSVMNINERDEDSSPKKSKKGKLSRSKSESVSISERNRTKSPSKKRGSKTEHFSDEDEDDEEDITISERSDEKSQNGKPKPKKLKDVVFSDEEEDSPFGISGKGGKNYWRRTTYLDILKIEKERRESIKKMKDEKEKEREKNGGGKEKDKNGAGKFIRDSYGNKVFLNAKGKKGGEDEPPDNIDIAVQDIVSKTLVTGQHNYGRNRDSLSSMIKRKLKEDHYLRSLCQTDEWFLKNIVTAMVTFGPMMKVITRTQALTWIFLSRLTQFWSREGKTPPNEKDLFNDPETIAFASELCKLCYKLLVSDQVR